MPARYVHVGHRGLAPEFSQTLCGKLAGAHTPLAWQPEGGDPPDLPAAPAGGLDSEEDSGCPRAGGAMTRQPTSQTVRPPMRLGPHRLCCAIQSKGALP